LTCSYTPVIPALRRVRQEDHKFEASLGCIKMTLSQKKKKTNKNKNPSTIYLSCSKEHTDPKIHVGMQET
jgi:hypothetical protein